MALANHPNVLGRGAPGLSGGATTPVGSNGTSTDKAIVRWNGTTGSVVQNSTVTLSDAGLLQFPVHTAPTTGIALGATQQIWTGATGEMSFGFSGTASIRINNNVSQITVAPGGSTSAIFNATGMALSATRTLQLGTISGATIGVSADTTAGNLVLTSTTTGNIDAAIASAAMFRVSNGASGAGQLVLGDSGFSNTWIVGRDNQSTGNFVFNSGGTLRLSISGTSSLLGGAGSMTITAGTGNSRTLALQSTTSGGVATTFLTGDATQGVTLANNLTLAGTALITKPGGTIPLITTNTAITTGAGVGTGTITNAPTAGNPTKWIPINDNGTTRYFPAW